MQTGKVPVECNFEVVQQAHHLGVEKYHSAGACSLKYEGTYPSHEMHEEIVVYWCMDIPSTNVGRQQIFFIVVYTLMETQYRAHFRKLYLATSCHAKAP